MLKHFALILIASSPVVPLPQKEAPHNCPVCVSVLRRAEQARGSVPSPVVTREAPGTIRITGAAHAGTRPILEPIREGNEIRFEADPDTDYTVAASVIGPAGITIPFDFFVPVPDTANEKRILNVRRYMLAVQRVEALRNELEFHEQRAAALLLELSPISVFEYSEALRLETNEPIPIP